MHKELQFSIEGVSPLLMHNSRMLTNPLHPLTKCIKTFSGKKTKTDADSLAISKLEWVGGLYLSESPEISVQGSNVSFACDGVITIPGEVLEALLREGAKKSKLGTAFKSGVSVVEDFQLQHEGSNNLEEMWESGNFADMRNVKIQTKQILRTRPIFRKWALDFKVLYSPTVVNANQVYEALDVAGKIIGLCDYRPKHGRFSVVNN